MPPPNKIPDAHLRICDPTKAANVSSNQGDPKLAELKEEN